MALKKIIQEKLEEAQKTYESIEEISGERVPESDYVGVLEGAEIRLSSEQKPMILRGHRITEGENEGVHVGDFLSLMNGFGKGQARSWVELMGYQFPEKLVDLPDTLEAIVAEEPSVEFTVKHPQNSDTLVNVNVTNLLGEGEGETGSTPAEESPSAPSAEDEAAEEQRKEMLVFCGAWDLDCSKDDDYDTLFKIIKDNEYAEEKLDEEEKALLEALDLQECIEKPKPKVQRKVASKAVKKTTGKARKIKK